MLARAYFAPSSAVLALALVPAAQLSVHVVDDDAGPGVDYPDIAAALASPAVADGDLLLVQDGTYGAFSIDGRGMTVVAESGADVKINGTVDVRNVPSGSEVVLRGLATGIAGERGLAVASCDGAVWIEDCELLGQTGAWYHVPSHPNGWAGAEISFCASVVIADSTFVGGTGGSYSDWKELGGLGAIGLDVASSSVLLANVQATGGLGGSAWGDLAGSGLRGGHGLKVLDATVVASGSQIGGGQGGYGGSDWTWGGCGTGGDGGEGVVLYSGSLTEHDTSLLAGLGGWGGYGCPQGGDGEPIAAPGGTHVLLPGDAHGFTFPSPAREGTTVAIEMSGHAGDVALGLFDLTPGHLFVPALAGVLVTAPSPIVVALGVVPGSGVLSANLPLGLLVSPADGSVVFAQGGFFNPTTGELALGEPSAAIVLNAGL